MSLLDRLAAAGPGRFVAVVLCCVAGQAAAQQPTQAQRDAIKESCRSDYQAYCASVPSGGEASLQCLQQHLTGLSPSCQSAVSAVSTQHAPTAMQAPPPAMSRRQQATMMRRACGRDFAKYCSEVKPGEGRALACLEGNQSRLSPACKSALAELHGAR
ncbi:cysteine rich repeat-containing protein [Rhodopila globiformis]|uniref:Cysteine rich repeat-containing protein n=1 Tax=Rhodopila globiformis TaxID=1071 RepID=A0A2S6NJZ4_RHOGL|nr:hypothetical protein CCS01_08400 [Rhodopila globiformis]